MFHTTSANQKDYIWAKLHTIWEIKAVIVIKGNAEQA